MGLMDSMGTGQPLTVKVKVGILLGKSLCLVGQWLHVGRSMEDNQNISWLMEKVLFLNFCFLYKAIYSTVGV